MLCFLRMSLFVESLFKNVLRLYVLCLIVLMFIFYGMYVFVVCVFWFYVLCS